MKNYRNPRLLALARQAPRCMSCGRANDGTVVAAHSNAQRHGKGMGIKAHDLPAYLCFRCHSEVDGVAGSFNRHERDRIWLDGMFQTFLWLLQEGHLQVARPRQVAALESFPIDPNP